MRHCLTTRRVLVRGDGSVAHEGIFDLETRRVSEADHAAGLSGRFLLVARTCLGVVWVCDLNEYSRDPRLLQTAEACADYYITHTPANGVPPWDFNAPA